MALTKVLIPATSDIEKGKGQAWWKSVSFMSFIVYCGLEYAMKVLSSGEIIVFLIAFCAILIMTAGLHWFTRRSVLSVFHARKLLHFFALAVSALVIQSSQERTLLSIIFLSAFFILLIVSYKRLLFSETQTSYGIAFFALAFGLLLLSSLPTEAIFYAALVTAVCDPIAGWAGMKWGRGGSIFLFEKKSWPGFLAFYLSCLLISVFFIGITPQLAFLALIPALSELFSWRGSDNLLVPVISAIWFTLVQHLHVNLDVMLFLGLMATSMMLVFKKHWLTPEGIAAAIWMGMVIFVAGSWSWLAAIALFFVAGSLSSKWLGQKKEGTGRNAVQVFSNGAVASCCAVLYALHPDVAWLMGFLVSVGVCLSDTLSSDVGMKIRQQPYDIITFRAVPVGLSGGVTLAGTLAGLTGASMLALVGGYLFSLSWYQVLTILLFSQAGMIIDSILGSLLQGKFIGQNGEVVEEREFGFQLVRGYSSISNDGVNLLANVIIVLIVVFLYI